MVFANKDLSSIAEGFADIAQTSQKVYRCALNAMSYPGRLFELSHDASTPKDTDQVVSGLLLALLDSETSLWCSDKERLANACEWLQFHTDCVVLDSPEQADFLWMTSISDFPNLALLKAGTDEYPDRSATCIIEVPKLSEKSDDFFTLKGPGIQFEGELHIKGWSNKDHKEWLSLWTQNHQLFPCGVDVYLSDGQHLLGLPRSTKLSYLQGVN